MANLLDYLDWRGDLTLKQAPFCEKKGAKRFCLRLSFFITLDKLGGL